MKSCIELKYNKKLFRLIVSHLFHTVINYFHKIKCISKKYFQLNQDYIKRNNQCPYEKVQWAYFSLIPVKLRVAPFTEIYLHIFSRKSLFLMSVTEICFASHIEILQYFTYIYIYLHKSIKILENLF